MQDDHHVTNKLFNIYSMWNSKIGWLLRLKIPLRQFMLKHSSNFNILYIIRYITPHHTSFPILLISPFPTNHNLKDFLVLCQDSVQHSGGIHHTVSSHMWEKKQGTLPWRCCINAICFLQCMQAFGSRRCWIRIRIRIQTKVFLWQGTFFIS